MAKIVDDSCLYDKDIETCFWHTLDYIQLCSSNGIVFNPTKFVFAKDEVDIAGFLITSDRVKPTPKIIVAIENFPTPTNITGIRSWFDLINQVSYAFAQAPIMASFRELLGKNKKFY